MSTENNLQTLYENSVKILTDLIAFKTISGEDNNSLINYCDEILKKLPSKIAEPYFEIWNEYQKNTSKKPA